MELQNSARELAVLDPAVDIFTNNNQSIIVLPTLHNQVHFSQIAHQILIEKGVDRCLVELPQELEPELTAAIDRLPLPTIVHNGNLEMRGEQVLSPDSRNAYIVHPGESLYWTSYFARKSGIPVRFVDNWHERATLGWSVPLGYEHLASIGWTRFFEEGSEVLQQHYDDPLHSQRSVQMALRIGQNLEGSVILVVIGAAHWPAVVNHLRDLGFAGQSMVPDIILDRYRVEVRRKINQDPGLWISADIHPHSLHLLTGQLPFHLGLFVEDPLQFNLLESIRHIYFTAEKRYTTKFDDQVSPANYTRLFQYLRNLGRLQARIIPNLYNLITGAKGMVDDDFAFEVYRTAISYPFLPKDEERLDEMLKFTPDESQGEVIRFAFKRRIRRAVLKKMDQNEFDDLDPIPEEEYDGEWQEIWDKYSPYGYVSYPPEDVFIENYMQYLRKRIVEILMEEESATMEFDTSMEDGIDWRETMRHYHEGKIYVKKYPKNKYTVGALIVQFLEEPFDTSDYNHHSTLFAEHDQESHISVITTRPGDIIVGPGISRVKYAAIISQFPPVAMPYFISKENIDLKLRLIWTAINMSLNKIIGFVAKKPPTAAQRHFAAEQGYRLVFLPMGQLTPSSLHRLRTMHLLAHRDLRDNAREYIGF
ncbi:MAG: hypothetical protein ACXAE3_03650 [Candidatus Kariarchaeaceae archaeon]